MSEVRSPNALLEAGVSPQVKRLPYHTLSELLVPASGAIDLAEGRSIGHAQRIAYIATSLGVAAGLESPSLLACAYAALLHDVGVVAAGAGLASLVRGDERMLFASLPLLSPEEAAVGSSDSPEIVVERVVDHVIHGARASQRLDLPVETVKGISTHHENWDGTGYPHGSSGPEIPVIGRIIALAEHIETMIEQTTPLLARRNIGHWLTRVNGREADPTLVRQLRDITNEDSFWLGMFSDDMPAELSARLGRLREPRSMRLQTFSETFAHLVDSRFAFTDGVSEQVADLAESLGRATGLPDLRCKQLRIAALWHDVGQLAVSERIMSKPSILSVDELELMRLHPGYSHDIVTGINGLEEVAEWIACHHERMDGRGYPDGLEGDEIPVEARMLAIADAYVAICSDRPHRKGADPKEAARQLRASGGTQLDAQLVDVFLSSVVS